MTWLGSGCCCVTGTATATCVNTGSAVCSPCADNSLIPIDLTVDWERHGSAGCSSLLNSGTTPMTWNGSGWVSDCIVILGVVGYKIGLACIVSGTGFEWVASLTSGDTSCDDSGGTRITWKETNGLLVVNSIDPLDLDLLCTFTLPFATEYWKATITE